MEKNIVQTLTNAGLREILFQELDLLRRGEVTPKRAYAVASVADKILLSARMDLEAQNSLGVVPNDSLAGGTALIRNTLLLRG